MALHVAAATDCVYWLALAAIAVCAVKDLACRRIFVPHNTAAKRKLLNETAIGACEQLQFGYI